jgi:hypothetical protein
MTQESVVLNEVRDVADAELVAQLRRLVRADQTLTARLLVHLGEVDARGLYREHAYSSMFAYCVEELHMSESEAYLRIHAARLGRQYPLVVQLLAQGAVHLTAIKLLAPQLTADNHVQLLERAKGKGKREIELLLAEIAPKPDVPNRMRKLPEPSAARPDTRFTPTSVGAGQAPQSALDLKSSEACAPNRAPESAPPTERSCDPNRMPFALEAPRPRASTKPLSPGRYKLELTAGQALHDKLQQLQNLLRHQVPDGDLAVLVERAVDLLIDKTMQQRFAQTRAPKKKPLPVKRRTRSRYIPRAVVRAVHQRDAGRCTFVSPDGKRCSEHGFLELHHHDVPYARGGQASVENLRLVCRAHNALFAQRDYGAEVMCSKRRQTREPFEELEPDSPERVVRI